MRLVWCLSCMLQIPCTSQVIRNIALDILTAHDFTPDHCAQIKKMVAFYLCSVLTREVKCHFLRTRVFFSFNRNTKQIKTDTTYNTTYNRLLTQYTIQYFLRLQFLQYFLPFVFRLHTHVPSKLQCKTGFHLDSNIFILLYLAAI